MCNFVKKAIGEGHRPEMVGGGLIRSLGGWSSVKTRRRPGEREFSDARILGNGKFGARIVKEAEANIKCQLPLYVSAERENG
jgi:putative transposase